MGEQILHMQNRQWYSEKVMLGKMTSRARMKQYLKQTLYLEYQCTQYQNIGWMLNPIQLQKAEEKSPVEKIHQRLLNTENYCLWLKLSLGDRLSGT